MSPPKILVVDDSSTVRTIVTKALREAGYTVVTATDGAEAVERAREERPQLAILDIYMPFLDGYGVCQEFKNMGKPWSDLPIVFLTSVESHALELLGDKMGAYLHKPVCRDQLISTVAEIVPLTVASGADPSGAVV